MKHTRGYSVTITAKPVIDKQYWILRKDNKKVGAIEAQGDGFVLRLQDRVATYKTIPMVRDDIEIEFAPAEKITPPATDSVHGFSTGCKVYNAMWDVKQRLPLFTKEEKSKSWYAAGWYRVKQHRNWRIMQNPKLIVLERYQYQGPFYNEEQARDQSVS